MTLLIDVPSSAPTLLGFGIGGPEIIVLLVIIGIPIAIVLVVLAIVRASQKSGGPPPLSGTRSTEARLKELDSLRASGAITESEYEENRRKILDDL